MKREIKAGEHYRHFKGMEYQILAVGLHTETEEPEVVYQALYGEHQVYVRPLDMFASEVDHEKYPEVTQQYRFERIPEPAALSELPKEALLKAMQDYQQGMTAMFEAEKKQKVRSYRELNSKAVKGQILFTGSSLMEQFPVSEIAMSDRGCCSDHCTKLLYNRGIGGTTTDDFLREMDAVCLDLEPSVLFINIGTNDMNERADGEDWEEHLFCNLETIYQIINEKLPETEVYVMAYYPVNPTVSPQGPEMLKTRTNEALDRVNGKIKELAARHGFTFIDCNQALKDDKGMLRADLTKEGMHMYAGAYQLVYEALKQYL